MAAISHEAHPLTIEEERFFFEVVFPGLDARRDALDRDLFILLARRLLDAGYTADQLELYVTAADQSRSTEQ